MTIQIEGKTFYSPSEAAERLGLSIGMLRYHRNTGNIEGVEMGTTTYYSEEQLKAARLEKKKRGPKKVTVEGNDEGEEGRSSSVMLKEFGLEGRLLGMAS